MVTFMLFHNPFRGTISQWTLQDLERILSGYWIKALIEILRKKQVEITPRTVPLQSDYWAIFSVQMGKGNPLK